MIALGDVVDVQVNAGKKQVTLSSKVAKLDKQVVADALNKIKVKLVEFGKKS